jgi:hypothetical protein
MKKIVLFASVVVFFAGSYHASAQTKNASATAQNAGASDGFVLQNHALVLRMDAHSAKLKPQDVALTKDVVLANGTRINYKTAVVEYADGRQVTLQDGDFVSMSGDVQVAGSGQLIKAVQPAPASPATPVAAAFTYKAAEPVNGKLKGVVELGASGFNSFIVRMDEQRRWKMEKSEFGNSLVMENLATEDDVRKGLKSYIGQMLDFGVGPRDIHFVVSSGAAKSENTLKIVQALKALNYVVTIVTPAEEGTMALRATLPATYIDKAFVVDIGSANTKVSWLQSGKVSALETHGAKYFQQGLADSVVAAEVRAKLQQVPADKRATCFIIGGVPYELSKSVRKGEERYVVLGTPDSYNQLSGAKSKAGVNIYRAVAEATGCKQFVFDSSVNFTIGYLLGLPQ